MKKTANLIVRDRKEYQADIYPYNVQIMTDGQYAGKGKFCRNLDEVIDFCKQNNIYLISIK